jgi:hypothetical protein
VDPRAASSDGFVVCRQHEDGAGEVDVVEKYPHHEFAGRGVEVASRFVGKQELWAAKERSSHRHPLHLPPGQLGGTPGKGHINAHGIEQPGRLGRSAPRRSPAPVQRWFEHVGQDRSTVVQTRILKHEPNQIVPQP